MQNSAGGAESNYVSITSSAHRYMYSELANCFGGGGQLLCEIDELYFRGCRRARQTFGPAAAAFGAAPAQQKQTDRRFINFHAT